MLEGGKKTPSEVRHQDHIADTHASLFERGIFTKSMVKLFMTCPEKFRLQYVEGIPFEERYSTALGKALHDTMEEWGMRAKIGKRFPMKERQDMIRDRWDLHMVGLDVPEGGDINDKIVDFTAIMQDWDAFFKKERFGKIEGVEQAAGYDGNTKMGDVPIAGHMDLVTDKAVLDFKVCNMRSWYRQKKPVDVELAMYSVLTGKDEAYLIPMVHDFKRPPATGRVEKVGGKVTKEQIDSVTAIVNSVARSVQAGIFPPPPQIGDRLCTSTWCAHWGKCTFTKGM